MRFSQLLLWGLLSIPVSASDAPSEACPNCESTSQSSSAVRDWFELGARKKLETESSFVNQDSKEFRFSDFSGKPVIMVFFFTRCANPRKCPLAVLTIASLQLKLKDAALHEKAQVLLITLDPEYDNPKVLKAYGEKNKFQFSDNAMILRPLDSEKEKVFSDLGARVSYNNLGVNIHNLQLMLLDKHGRLACIYQSVIWDNESVLEDLRILIGED